MPQVPPTAQAANAFFERIIQGELELSPLNSSNRTGSEHLDAISNRLKSKAENFLSRSLPSAENGWHQKRLEPHANENKLFADILGMAFGNKDSSHLTLADSVQIKQPQFTDNPIIYGSFTDNQGDEYEFVIAWEDLHALHQQQQQQQQRVPEESTDSLPENQALPERAREENITDSQGRQNTQSSPLREREQLTPEASSVLTRLPSPTSQQPPVNNQHHPAGYARPKGQPQDAKETIEKKGTANQTAQLTNVSPSRVRPERDQQQASFANRSAPEPSSASSAQTDSRQKSQPPRSRLNQLPESPQRGASAALRKIKNLFSIGSRNKNSSELPKDATKPDNTKVQPLRTISQNQLNQENLISPLTQSTTKKIPTAVPSSAASASVIAADSQQPAGPEQSAGGDKPKPPRSKAAQLIELSEMKKRVRDREAQQQKVRTSW